MPILPLPVGGSSLDGGDLPVSDAADVLKEFPETMRVSDDAPVRDAFCEAFAAGHIAYQDASRRAAAQCDPLRAVGEYLRSLANEKGITPGKGEDDETLRARIFSTPLVVTPEALHAAINAVLAPYTDSVCHISELNLDGWFCHGDTAVWDSFIGAEPEYPDRYYEDLPETLPGGAVPSAGRSRSFLVRVPKLDGADKLFTYVFSETDTNIGIFGAVNSFTGPFVGDGSDTGGSESSGALGWFLYSDPKTSDDLYDKIISIVNRIKGQGMSWTMIVDPRL